MVQKTNFKNSQKVGAYKTSKRHRQVVKEYDEKHTQSIRVKLNKKTDKDILNKLNGSSNKQGMIKQALRGRGTQSVSKRTKKSTKKELKK